MVVVSGAPAAFSVRIGEVRANLAAARELLRVVREEPGADPDEIAMAEAMLIEAKKAYRKLVPSDTDVKVKERPSESQGWTGSGGEAGRSGGGPVVEQAVSVEVKAAEPVSIERLESELRSVLKDAQRGLAVDDPGRLSGTEIRRRAKKQAAEQGAAEVPAVAAERVKERAEQARWRISWSRGRRAAGGPGASW